MTGNKKKILITGINGFLGSHLAVHLIRDYFIVGLANNVDNLFRINDLNLEVYSEIDKNLEELLMENDFYAIIHTATVYKAHSGSFENILKTNILLPVKLFQLSQKYNVKIFINTDTFFNQQGSKYSYLSEYTLSKKHCLEWLSEIKGVCKLVNLKIFHMYGPNDNVEKFVPSIISALIKNTSSLDLTAGEQIRDFIYVEDVVSAFACVLKHAQSGEKMQEEYEVGSGNPISIKEFVLSAKKIINSKTTLNFGALEYRSNEIMFAEANNKPLYNIGWKINTPLDQGLSEVVNYHLQLK